MIIKIIMELIAMTIAATIIIAIMNGIGVIFFILLICLKHAIGLNNNNDNKEIMPITVIAMII